MSKKNTKKPVEEKVVAEKTEGTSVHKLLDQKNLAIIITSAIVAVVLLAVAIFVIVDRVKNDRGFDYLKSDLSKYVYISPEDYKNYKLNVDIASPKPVDMETAILAIIASNKGDRLCGENQWLSSGNNLVVTPGSSVKVWYRGYQINEKGEQVEIAGLTNFGSSVPDTVNIGELSYPPGFEVGLVGASLSADRVRFSKVEEGEIKEDYVLYISYTKTATTSDSKTSATNVRVDLSTDVDATYGQGFKTKLLAMKLGESKEFTLTDATGVHCSYKVEASYATTCEKNDGILKIETYFPYSYNIVSLRNEEVIFEVYIDSIQPYEYDEFDDEFVLELISKEGSAITKEELLEYDGETAVEKYRAYLQTTFDESYAESYDELLETAMWEHLHKVAVIKKYPASKVDPIYKEYLTDIQEQFDANGGKLWNNSLGQYQTYETLDKFADAYYGVTSTVKYSWRDYLRETAEKLVAERMILYYIMDQENLAPTEEVFNNRLAELKQEYLDAYVEKHLEYDGKTKEDFETDADYEAYVYEREVEIFSFYDDEYFKESTHYQLLLETIMSWANVSTLDDRSASGEIK